jgi:hypothetical protein
VPTIRYGLVLDPATLKSAREKQSAKKLILADAQKAIGNRPERRRREARGDLPSEFRALIDLLSTLPHPVQSHPLGDDFRAWRSLAEESIVGPSSDLALKHGAYVPGERNILGVLDALPDPPQAAAGADGRHDDTNAAAASLATAATGTSTAN